MLWDLTSEATKSYFKCWNKQARLSWRVDYRTHTYLLEDLLCDSLTSLRVQILSRYPEFIRKLQNSPCREVRFMVNIVKDDARSKTAQNIKHISSLIDDNCLLIANWKMKELLPRTITPPFQLYRKNLLTYLLDLRLHGYYSHLGMGKQALEEMIKSLCVS